MSDEYEEDAPVGQRLRVMNVLDVTPGRAQDPVNGPPIGILTLEFKGEIEQSIMFNIDDCRRLAVGFMAVLADHGNETAEEIVLKYFAKDKRDNDD